ncbi:SIMPL domain-containing protein [Streptantibioticus rubrisoli]|uniref:SIMPL domain-containing protein n=1 Tax=Streptantibioticus rubrisoli TaxID=1387313 RepID=A0ABT1PPH1_9ACTN|nr:SIMPL domain-containing protein [Streptantibioticus rubrisoli]MCQ4046138.1 SIMPL domain-containing protein [Streptantibioticus rubrisoli]
MTTTPPAPQDQPHQNAPRLGVRGEAHTEAEPELARITITVNARGTDRRAALDDLTRRNNTVLDLIRTHPEAIEKTQTSALVITPELAKGRGERIRSYHGRVQLDVTLNDFTALGELITRLTELDLTRIDGPWWSLRPDSPAYRTARTQAVHDAVRRAREYAEALGGEVTALLELADTGVESSAAHHNRSFAPAAPGGTAGAQTPAITLEPQRQTVHAQVTAHFTMTPPDLRTP